MYAPIYHQQAAPKSPELLAAEAAIIEEEGPNTVKGRYYAREYDASFWRALEAEKRVREAARLRKLAEIEAMFTAKPGECSYCLRRILDGEETVELSGAILHREPCAREHWEFSQIPTTAEIDALINERVA